MNQKRARHCMTLVNENTVMVIGGEEYNNEDYPEFTRDTRFYNVTSNEWTNGPKMEGFDGLLTDLSCATLNDVDSENAAGVKHVLVIGR